MIATLPVAVGIFVINLVALGLVPERRRPSSAMASTQNNSAELFHV